jgi:hypothetical protein
MKVDIRGATMNLERAQILKLQGAKGVRLACRQGCLWVTQEGIERDDFLVPGVGLEIEVAGVVVIEAMMASSVAIDSRGLRAPLAPALQAGAA